MHNVQHHDVLEETSFVSPCGLENSSCCDVFSFTLNSEPHNNLKEKAKIHLLILLSSQSADLAKLSIIHSQLLPKASCSSHLTGR